MREREREREERETEKEKKKDKKEREKEYEWTGRHTPSIQKRKKKQPIKQITNFNITVKHILKIFFAQHRF